MAVPEQLWEHPEGSVLMLELGSCSVCVCVRAGRCQLWHCRCSCSPLWVPGAAWLCPSPAASYLVSVITSLLQLLFLSSEGMFVSQEMAPVCGGSGSAEELLLCSSQGSAAAPEAAGPKSFAGLGQEELQSEASSDLSPAVPGCCSPQGHPGAGCSDCSCPGLWAG